MFVGHTKKVTFIVSFENSTRLHPQETVIKPVVNFSDEAAHYKGAGPVCHHFHPFGGLHVHHLTELLCFHRKASGEHFRQDDHVGRLADARDPLFEHMQVRVDILPMGIGLN
jgi:hypothetical protein